MKTRGIVGDLAAIPGVKVRTEVALARLTTFKIGGPAAVLVTPESTEGLAAAMRLIRDCGRPSFALGNGSNLLVSDEGFDGVVLRMGSAMGFTDAGPGDELRLGAGTLWSRVLRFLMNEGWTGLEFGAGIPGTIGGAVATNAGTRAGQTADRVIEIEIVDCDGEIRTLKPEDLRFRYRGADGIPAGAVVTSARFAMGRESPANVTSIVRRCQAERRRDQPEREPSAGCIFKNPPGESAGRLIDAAGLKGTREGGALISPVHGNFIINRDGSTAADVLRLVDRIRERVLAEHGIELEMEVRKVGFA